MSVAEMRVVTSAGTFPERDAARTLGEQARILVVVVERQPAQ
jgi:hypothetical protein